MNVSSEDSEQALLSLFKVKKLFSGGDLAAIQEPEGLTGSSSIIGRGGDWRYIIIGLILFTVQTRFRIQISSVPSNFDFTKSQKNL